MGKCDEGECLQALTRLQAARNRILSLCDLITQLRADQEAHRAMVKLYEMTLLLLAGLGAWAWFLLPPPLNGIGVAVLALTAIGVLIALVVQQNAIARLELLIIDTNQNLLTARSDLDSAVAEVMATCDPECWSLVDMDQPACPADEAVARRRPAAALWARH